MSRFIRHTSCPTCGSSDGLAVYDDNRHCFVCNFHVNEEGYETISDPHPIRHSSDRPITPLPGGEQVAIKDRNIASSSVNKYRVTVDTRTDSQVAHVYPYFDENGAHVANKVRRKGEKAFYWEGDVGRGILFGQQLFPAGGKAITIVEGECDALAGFQLTGSRYPCVSVKSASEAKRNCADNFEYLNSFEKIVLCFDSDEPGQKAAHQVASLFAPGKVVLLKLSQAKDPNDYLMLGLEKEFVNEWFRAPVYMPDGLRIGTDESLLDEIINYKEPECIPYPWPGLNNKLYGIRLSEMTLFLADTGVGKALSLDTPLPTPDGWTTMGDVQKGDKLIDANGNICTVLKATDVMYDRECFEVCFDDGSVVVADAEHNWFTQTHKERVKNSPGKVRTTLELLKTLNLSAGRSNHAVPVSAACSFDYDCDLVIPPYTLGAWLGDGSTGTNVVYSDDAEVIDNIREDGFIVEDLPPKYAYRIVGLRKALKNAGLLGYKHIPTEYLRASKEQRLSLLQGLMDTDGYCAVGNKTCQYTTILRSLAESVYELAVSLGIKATLKEGRAKLNGNDCGPKFTISFTTRLPVFRLKRKLDRLPTYGGNGRTLRRYVTDIRPVPSVPVRCIQVSSPDSLFLCGKSFIPTHNTTFMKEIEYSLLTNEDLIERGYGVGFLHLEEPKRETLLGMLSIHHNKPYHLPDTPKSPEDVARAYHEVLNNKRVVVYDHFGSNDIEAILSKIRHMAALGCKYIVLDHLSIIVSDQSGDERRQLDEISTKLKTLTMNLEIAVIAVIHINRQGQVRGSAGPEQVSNNVVRLTRDKKEIDDWRRNVTQLDVEKCRLSGRTGPACWIYYDNETGRLVELSEELAKKFQEGSSVAGSEFEAYGGP